MNPFNRIKRGYEDLTHIAKSCRNPSPPPTTIIMNLSFFSKWFYWCEENDYDHERWEGVQIIIDKESPAPLAFSYHPDQETLEETNEKLSLKY